MGLALDLYLDAGYEPGAGDLTIRRAGTLRDLDVKLADDRLVLAFLAELSRRGIQNPGGMLLTTSAIPVARGLGSSAAATVAGIALAVTACGDSLDRDAALAAAMRVEGHPDNAAPALFGGLIAIAGSGHGVPHAMRLPLSDQVSFVFAAPAVQVSTTRARTVLPQHVPQRAVVGEQLVGGEAREVQLLRRVGVRGGGPRRQHLVERDEGREELGPGR